jgi:hypothetical protein
MGLYIGAIVALVGAWPTLPLRWMWLAISFVSGGFVVLWETHTRTVHQNKIENLRRHEKHGRSIELVLSLVLSFGIAPGHERTDYWPLVSEWLDIARDMAREIGGPRYVDIFNATAGVAVELPQPLAPNMAQELQYFELLSRHLHQFRQIIHEVELGR